MKFKFKRFMSVILIAMMLLSFFTACQYQGAGGETSESDSSSEPDETTGSPKPTTSDYTIQRINGNCYIVFDDISAYKIQPPEDGTCIYVLPGLEFSSVKELKELSDKVTQRKLDEDDKRHIANYFGKDENGIPICDFDQLLVPQLPEGYELLGGVWEGRLYYLCSESQSQGTATFYSYSAKAYEDIFQRKYTNAFDEAFRKEHPELREERLTDRNAVQFSYKNGRNIRYTLSAGDKTFAVDEIYSSNADDVVPRSVKLYCADGEFNYIIELRPLSERPSVEFLLSLGMEVYSE